MSIYFPLNLTKPIKSWLRKNLELQLFWNRPDNMILVIGASFRSMVLRECRGRIGTSFKPNPIWPDFTCFGIRGFERVFQQFRRRCFEVTRASTTQDTHNSAHFWNCGDYNFSLTHSILFILVFVLSVSVYLLYSHFSCIL
jgi:hypothetical protein